MPAINDQWLDWLVGLQWLAARRRSPHALESNAPRPARARERLAARLAAFAVALCVLLPLALWPLASASRTATPPPLPLVAPLREAGVALACVNTQQASA